jgi:hypothetical protein
MDFLEIHCSWGWITNHSARAGHVGSNASDPANGLVPHDESAVVYLRGLGGVQVTSADAAEVYVDEHLIVPGYRRWSVLEADAAIAPQDHRRHFGRSGSRSTRRHFLVSQPLRLRKAPGPAR